MLLLLLLLGRSLSPGVLSSLHNGVAAGHLATTLPALALALSLFLGWLLLCHLSRLEHLVTLSLALVLYRLGTLLEEV